jgi:hypothetical protein
MTGLVWDTENKRLELVHGFAVAYFFVVAYFGCLQYFQGYDCLLIMQASKSKKKERKVSKLKGLVLLSVPLAFSECSLSRL